VTNVLEWFTEKILENKEAFMILAMMVGAAIITFLLIVSPVAQVIAIIAALMVIIGALVKAWPQIKEWAIETWEKIKEAWAAAGPWFITNVWQPLTTWAANTLNSIGEFFENIWNSIKGAWQSAGPWFVSNVWQPISDWASSVWANISQWASDAWEGIKSVWGAVTDWISANIVDPIQTAFTDAWENIKSAFETAFGAIVEFAKGIINSVIDLINGLINGVVSGMNAIINALNGISVSIPDWVPKIGGQTFGINLETITAPQIPKLATGAVIPPNSEFLAVLGDQRSGRNIETPEGLMRQIVREELASGGQEVTINFGGSLGALVRELKPYIDKENQRIGRSMVKGL
jgi:phage-related protein